MARADTLVTIILWLWCLPSCPKPGLGQPRDSRAWHRLENHWNRNSPRAAAPPQQLTHGQPLQPEDTAPTTGYSKETEVQSLRFQDPGFLRCPQWPLVVPDTRRHHRPHPFLRQVNDLPLARVSNLCKMRNTPHPLLTADQSGSPRVPWSQGSGLPCSLPRLWAYSVLGPVRTLWRPEALV